MSPDSSTTSRPRSLEFMCITEGDESHEHCYRICETKIIWAIQNTFFLSSILGKSVHG